MLKEEIFDIIARRVVDFNREYLFHLPHTGELERILFDCLRQDIKDFISRNIIDFGINFKKDYYQDKFSYVISVWLGDNEDLIEVYFEGVEDVEDYLNWVAVEIENLLIKIEEKLYKQHQEELQFEEVLLKIFNRKK